MKQKLTFLIAGLFCFFYAQEVYSQGGTVPEILYYKFDGVGITIPNESSNPPAGTLTATIVGGQTLGGVGLCGGALIGNGGAAASNNVATGWNTALGTGAWTIAFWTDNIPNNTTLYYQFGDAGASSFRCFNNGVAGANNWMLRGPVTDVPCIGCAPMGPGTPSMSVFVYDPVLGNITSYHDGVLNTVVAQGALNINGSAFTVGAASGTGMGLGELMDEFRFYDRALDASEVFDTYNACLPLSSAPDDAGVASIDSPTNFCPGTETVTATIQNYGTNIIDSCIVQWEIDAVPQTPYYYYGPLDTAGGVGLATAQVTLGSATFAAGVTYNITAWTELPNAFADTVNANDTASVFVQSSLTGNFTIGGVAPNYIDFTTAAADITTYGVCGPVVFDVRSGTYTEQVSLGAIAGTDATNTVTFRSEDGHRDSVLLTFPSNVSASNYTVNFSGADFVSIEQITMQATGVTYGHVIEYGGGSENNTIWDSRIWGYAATTTSDFHALVYSAAGLDNNNSFVGNTFENGSYGTYWRGDGTTSLEVGSVYDNNIFMDQYYYGAYNYYQDAPVFTNNTMTSNSPYTGSRYGFYCVYCDNDMQVTGNSIAVGPNNYGYGMYFSNCDGAVGATSLITNNMVSVGDALTTSTSYGMYFTNSGRAKVYNNSVLVESDGASSRGIYITGGGAMELLNNSFKLEGPGYAAYYNTPFAISNTDYNNYYTNSGANYIWWSGANYTDLASYQAASSFDANSWDANPNYYGFGDLHACNDSLIGSGMPVAEVTVDIDGAPRDAATPDIGADEFSGIAPGFLGSDLSICTGDTLWLWAGAPSDTVVWSTGDTTNVLMVTTAGQYIADIVGFCGNGSDTIDIAASALVYTNFLAADTMFFCTPGSATLSSTMPGTSYLWSTTESTPTITVTAGGTYDLTLTDGCGSGTESIVITEVTAPVASFTGFNSFLTYSFTNTTAVGGGVTTYAWDFGDTGTSTDVDPIHVYTTNGMYFVTLTATNECGTHVYSDSVLVTLVGIEEMENGGSLSIYPNPNNGSFVLDIEIPENASVDMFVTNELGQRVFTKDLGLIAGSNQAGIDLGGVQSGIYFVTVNVDDQQFHYKMIVK